MKRQISEGVEISSIIPSKNSIQERLSIIAQAEARGLQLSEDGKSWVPINSESRNLPLDQNNAIIVKNQQLDNSQVTAIMIFYVFITVIVVIPSFWLVANIVYFFFWCLTFQWWNGDSFTPLSFSEIFSFFV